MDDSGTAGGSARDITKLLERWSGGDEAALPEVTGLLYAELKTIANSYLRKERPDHTLQPTALINEAYLRLAGIENASFENRRHFLALAARIMRQILVDHARHLKASKRGSGGAKLTLNETMARTTEEPDALLILDQALCQLAALNERHARVIELRYFGGLSVAETGEVLGISAPTVSRDQRVAEAWLNQALASGGAVA